MGQLVQALAGWYEAQKFDVQVLDLPATGAALPADTAAWLAGRYQEARRYAGEAPASLPPTAAPTPLPTPVSGEAAPAMTYRFCPNCGVEPPAGRAVLPLMRDEVGRGGTGGCLRTLAPWGIGRLWEPHSGDQ
ncbi:MAG: hypothetical protein RMK32_00640 [Anaerolineae bacterium]|nr:hypothetical protein [Thermoflexus sp.]MDW8064122.1 hypothetical protein [Anaerolineae bacterium]